MTLDLNLDTTTVGAVKATIDARLESIWRASGVRILRSDLPFCGVTLRYQNRLLAMDRVLSSCEVGGGSTLYAQWPLKSEKYERRKRYGKSCEPVLGARRRREEKEVRRPENGEKGAEKKVSRGGSKKRSSRVVDDTARSAPETDGDERISSGCVYDGRAGDEDEVEVEENGPDASRQDANERQDEQQANEEGQAERPTGDIEQDDPFADEDDDKENREPLPGAFAPVIENRMDDYPADEGSVFDGNNSGLGMGWLQEVFDF